jgi:hypothetical protein
MPFLRRSGLHVRFPSHAINSARATIGAVSTGAAPSRRAFTVRAQIDIGRRWYFAELKHRFQMNVSAEHSKKLAGAGLAIGQIDFAGLLRFCENFRKDCDGPRRPCCA